MTSSLGLADYQFYFGPAGGGGLTFGASTFVDVMRVDGLEDLLVVTTDRKQVGQHGDVPGIHLAEGKTFTVDLNIRRDTQTDAQWRNLIDNVEAVFTAERSTQQEFHWKFPGLSERFLYARTTRRRRLIDPDSELGIAALIIELRAPDPRFYAAAPTQLTGQTGTFNVTNNGKVKAYPVLTFNRGAGVTNVKVTNNTNGDIIDIQGLPDDQVACVADMDRYIRGDSGLIIYTGSTNQYGRWQTPRRPFSLEPGTNSLTLNTGTSIDVKLYDTYM